MGGQIDWAALPVIAEVYDLTDLEALVFRLETIRDHQNAPDPEPDDEPET
jgi:hypothetical protein